MTDGFETDFDAWIVETFAETGPFTILFVLVEIGDTRVDLRRSAFLHVTGDAIRWPTMEAMLESANVAWSGVVFFRAGHEGLVEDKASQRRLEAIVRKMHEDRTIIREGEFFNRDGLRLALSESELH